MKGSQSPDPKNLDPTRNSSPFTESTYFNRETNSRSVRKPELQVAGNTAQVGCGCQQKSNGRNP